MKTTKEEAKALALKHAEFFTVDSSHFTLSQLAALIDEARGVNCECTRSHPHENMDAMCELRTVIARLENEKAQLRGVDAEPVEKRIDMTAFTDMALVRESEILRAIADNLEVMLASAIQHQSDECVTGYTVKTGALHRIIGLLVGNGFRVNIPISPLVPARAASVPAPHVSLPSAHEWLDASSWEGSQEWMSGWDAARNRLQTIQLHASSAPSDPVAWRHRDPAWSGWATTNEQWKAKLPTDWEEEPLYTHPAPSQLAEPVKLTGLNILSAAIGTPIWGDLAASTWLQNRIATQLNAVVYTHPAPSQPAAPVELPVVAWFTDRLIGKKKKKLDIGDSTTNPDYRDAHKDWHWEPLVKLSDAQAAIAAGRKAS